MIFKLFYLIAGSVDMLAKALHYCVVNS